MPQIPEGVNPNPVRAQHSRNQFASARMAAENFVGGKGRVQEKPNSEVGSRRSEHRGEKHELVIMHPDQIALVHGLKHLFSEGPVYVLIMFPPGRFVTQIIGQVMQQWPDARPSWLIANEDRRDCPIKKKLALGSVAHRCNFRECDDRHGDLPNGVSDSRSLRVAIPRAFVIHTKATITIREKYWRSSSITLSYE